MSQTLLDELKALQALLIEGAGLPLSSREIVERALMLTLVQPSRSMKEVEEAFSLVKEFGSHGQSRARTRVRTPQTVISAALAEKWWNSIKDYRDWFRAALLQIVQDPASAREQLRKDIEAGLEKLAIVPRISWNGSTSKIELFYLSPDIEGICTYALILLLDAEGDLAKALRRCKLTECSRFFLAFPPDGGGPRPSYCTPDHRFLAVQKTGAERTERWRVNKARKAK